jgi:hypothetical protein
MLIITLEFLTCARWSSIQRYILDDKQIERIRTNSFLESWLTKLNKGSSPIPGENCPAQIIIGWQIIVEPCSRIVLQRLILGEDTLSAHSLEYDVLVVPVMTIEQLQSFLHHTTYFLLNPR